MTSTMPLALRGILSTPWPSVGEESRPRPPVLDGLDLEVIEGGVFGLIGPNGLLKVTGIRQDAE